MPVDQRGRYWISRGEVVAGLPQTTKTRKVINSPCAASRARVVCTGHTQTGITSDTCFSDHARVRAKARRRKFTEAEVAAWRERIFADGLEDPVKVAVGEAVRDFGRPEDFTLWAWYANRIGVNSFLELYFEQKSIMRACRLRSPAAAFHARLKRFYAAYFGTKGGAV